MASSVSFDRVAADYDETRGGEPRGAEHAERVAVELPRGGSVLELGVGTGLVAAPLRASGFDVLGMDLSTEMLRRARARLGPRVVAADAAALPVADGSVASAYSVWVLHLVGDREQVFREARRAVRPGGRYVVIGAGRPPDDDVDPVGAAWWRMRRAVRGEPERDEPAVLVELAQRAGWRVQRARHWPGHEFSESPREAVRRVEARAWSWLWDVDDATWERAVVPELARIAALADPGVARMRRSSEHVLVLA